MTRDGERESGRPSAGLAERRAGPGMLDEVREGLARSQKELPPKYFYDRRGSELFERITRLPEYYLTRSELEILRGPVREWIRDFGPASLVELGAGGARKTRVLLEAMLDSRSGPLYVPVDVSSGFLAETAGRLREELPSLRVTPTEADIGGPFRLDADPDRPALFALLGSTIGNFRRPRDVRLLTRVRAMMEEGDAFLMGADLRPGPAKPVERLEAAYDDAEGVTARFNRNMLRVLNRELGTDFDPGAFAHRAFYDPETRRIEMHLVAASRQAVELPDGTAVVFERGESVRTEVSCKYDRPAVAGLFREAGLELAGWFLDSGELYAVALGRRRDPGGGGEGKGDAG